MDIILVACGDDEGVLAVLLGVTDVEVVALAVGRGDADGINDIALVRHGGELDGITEDGGVETVLGGVARGQLRDGAVLGRLEEDVDLVSCIGGVDEGILHDNEVGIRDTRDGDRRFDLSRDPADEVVAGLAVDNLVNVRRDIGGAHVFDVLIRDERAVVQILHVVFVLDRLDMDRDGGGGHREGVPCAVELAGRGGVVIHTLARGVVRDIDLADDVAVVCGDLEADLLAHIARAVEHFDLCLLLFDIDGVVDCGVFDIDPHIGSGHMEGDGVRGVERVGQGSGSFVGSSVKVHDSAVGKDIVDPADLPAVLGRNSDGDLVLVVCGDDILGQTVHDDLAVCFGGGVLGDLVGLLGEDCGDDDVICRHIEVVHAVLVGEHAGLLAVCIGDGNGEEIVTGELLNGERNARTVGRLAVCGDLVDLLEFVGVVSVRAADDVDQTLARQLRIEALDDLRGVHGGVGLVACEVARLNVDAVVDCLVLDVDDDVLRNHREGEFASVKRAVYLGDLTEVVGELTVDVLDDVALGGCDVNGNRLALRNQQVARIEAVDRVGAALGDVLHDGGRKELRRGVDVDLDILSGHGEAVGAVDNVILGFLLAQGRLDDEVRALGGDDGDIRDHIVIVGSDGEVDRLACFGVQRSLEQIAAVDIAARNGALSAHCMDVLNQTRRDGVRIADIGRADDEVLRDRVSCRIERGLPGQLLPAGEAVALALCGRYVGDVLACADGNDAEEGVVTVKEGHGALALCGIGVDHDVICGHREGVSEEGAINVDDGQRDRLAGSGADKDIVRLIVLIGHFDREENGFADFCLRAVRDLDQGVCVGACEDGVDILHSLGGDSHIGVRHIEAVEAVLICRQLTDDKAHAVEVGNRDKLECKVFVGRYGELDKLADFLRTEGRGRCGAMLGRDGDAVSARRKDRVIDRVGIERRRQGVCEDAVSVVFGVDPVEEGLAGDGGRSRCGDPFTLLERFITVDDAAVRVKEADDAFRLLPLRGEDRVSLNGVGAALAVEEAGGLLNPAEEGVARLHGCGCKGDLIAVVQLMDILGIGRAAVGTVLDHVVDGFPNCGIDDLVLCIGRNRKFAACLDKARAAAPSDEVIAVLNGHGLGSEAVAALLHDYIIVQVAVTHKLDCGAACGDLLQLDQHDNRCGGHFEDVQVILAAHRQERILDRKQLVACTCCGDCLQNIALRHGDLDINGLTEEVFILVSGRDIVKLAVVALHIDADGVLRLVNEGCAVAAIGGSSEALALTQIGVMLSVEPEVFRIFSALLVSGSDQLCALFRDKDINQITALVKELDSVFHIVLRPNSAEGHVALDGKSGVRKVVSTVFRALPCDEGVALLLGCGQGDKLSAVGIVGRFRIVRVAHGIEDILPNRLEGHLSCVACSDGEVLHAGVGVGVLVVLPADEGLAVSGGIDSGDGGILSVVGKVSVVQLAAVHKADEAAQLAVLLPNSRQENVACGHGVLRACRMHVAALIDPALEDIAREHRLCQYDGVAVGDVSDDIGRHIGRVVVEELDERAVGQREDALKLGGIRLFAAVGGQVIGIDLEERDISLVRVDRVKFRADGVFRAGRQCLPAEEGVAFLDRLHGSCGRLAGEDVLKAVNRAVHEELRGVAVRLLDDLHRDGACGHYEGVAVHVRRVIGSVCRQRGDRNGDHFACRVLIVDADIVGLEACLGKGADGNYVAHRGNSGLGQNAKLHMLARNEGDRILIRLIDGAVGHILGGDGGVIQQIAVLVLPADEGVAFLGRCFRTGADQLILHDEAGVHQVALFGIEQDRIGIGNDRRKDDVASDGDVVRADELTDRNFVHVAGGQHPLGVGIQGVFLIRDEELGTVDGSLLHQIDIFQRAVRMAELDRPVLGVRSKDGKEIQVGSDAQPLQLACQEELAVVAVPAEELHAVGDSAVKLSRCKPIAESHVLFVIHFQIFVIIINRILVCRIGSLDHRIGSDRRIGIGIPFAGVAVLLGNCRDLRQRLAVADGVLRNLIAVCHECHGVLRGSVDREGGVAGDGNHAACVVLIVAEHPGRCRIFCVDGQSDGGVLGLLDQLSPVQIAVFADEVDRPVFRITLKNRFHNRGSGRLPGIRSSGQIEVAVRAAPAEEILSVGHIAGVVGDLIAAAKGNIVRKGFRRTIARKGVTNHEGSRGVACCVDKVTRAHLLCNSAPGAHIAFLCGNRRDGRQCLTLADGVLRDKIAVGHEGHGVLRGSLDHEGGVAGDGNHAVCVVLHEAISVVQQPGCSGILCVLRQGNLGIGLLLDKLDIIDRAVFAHELDCPVLRVLIEQRSKGEIARVVVNRRGGLEEHVALLADPAVEAHSIRHVAGIGLDKEGLAVGDLLRCRRHAGEADAEIHDLILLCRIDSGHGHVAVDTGTVEIQIDAPLAVIAVLCGHGGDILHHIAVAHPLLGDEVAVGHKADGVQLGSIDGEGHVTADGDGLGGDVLDAAADPRRLRIVPVDRHVDGSVLGLLDQLDAEQVAVLTDELDRPIGRIGVDQRVQLQIAGERIGIGRACEIDVAVIAEPGVEGLVLADAGGLGNGERLAKGDIHRLVAVGDRINVRGVARIVGRAVEHRRGGIIFLAAGGDPAFEGVAFLLRCRNIAKNRVVSHAFGIAHLAFHEIQFAVDGEGLRHGDAVLGEGDGVFTGVLDLSGVINGTRPAGSVRCKIFAAEGEDEAVERCCGIELFARFHKIRSDCDLRSFRKEAAVAGK